MLPTARNLGALALALGLLGACRSVAPPGTYFTTTPAGAEVIVGGRRTGFVTPCMLDLDRDAVHEVRLELGGFTPRSLWLVPASRTERVPWRDGALANDGLRTVFGLEAEAILVPQRVDDALAPTRVHVRLDPSPGAARASG